MKTLFFSLALLISFVARAEKPPEVPRLSGIIHLPDKHWAVLEYPDQRWGGPHQDLLSEGDRNRGVLVLYIYTNQNSVKMHVDGIQDPLTLSLNPASAPSKVAGSLVLADCSLHSILELYGFFSKRTLLYWPFLPTNEFSLSVTVTNHAQAAAALQRALAERQIEAVADGEKFILILPRDQVPMIKPHAPASGAQPEELPAGAINFHGVDMVEVIKIYAELKGARMDRSQLQFKFSQPYIFLRTRTPLSKEEALYAFETLFDWQGIKMVTGPDGLLRATQEAKR